MSSASNLVADPVKAKSRKRGSDEVVGLQQISESSKLTKTINHVGLTTPPMSESLDFSPAAKDNLSFLYSESVTAKIWGVAQRALNKVKTSSKEG